MKPLSCPIASFRKEKPAKDVYSGLSSLYQDARHFNLLFQRRRDLRCPVCLEENLERTNYYQPQSLGIQQGNSQLIQIID